GEQVFLRFFQLGLCVQKMAAADIADRLEIHALQAQQIICAGIIGVSHQNAGCRPARSVQVEISKAGVAKGNRAGEDHILEDGETVHRHAAEVRVEGEAVAGEDLQLLERVIVLKRSALGLEVALDFSQDEIRRSRKLRPLEVHQTIHLQAAKIS